MCILLICTIIPKDLGYILTCLLLLMESETTHILYGKKNILSANCLSFYKLYFIQFFCLFAGDHVKANDSELYLFKVFGH